MTSSQRLRATTWMTYILPYVTALNISAIYPEIFHILNNVNKMISYPISKFIPLNFK